MVNLHCSTEIVAGPGAAHDYVCSLGRRELATTVLFVDNASCDLAAIAALRDTLDIPDAQLIRVEAGADTVANLAQHAEVIRSAGPDARVIAIGGGLVIDTARLSTVISATDSRRLPQLLNPGRSGLVLLPSHGDRSPHVTAIPTTLGTGAEVSPVACLSHQPAKRIVLGEHLKPDVAIIDPTLTATLPQRLVEEGIIEVILRFVGPYLAAPSKLEMADMVALDEIRRLGALLDRSRANGLDQADRLEVSLRSANTRIGWGLAGRGPCSSKLWYLATALTDCVPVNKVPANLALLPVVLRQIVDGDHRFGIGRRVVDVERQLRPQPGGGPSDPANSAANIMAFLRCGQQATRLPGFDAEAIGRHAHRYWGSGQPMLGELSRTDLIQLYSSTTTSHTDREAANELVSV